MTQACPESGARVFLFATGHVTLNGRRMEATQLIDALMALAPAPTVICYSREDATGEPHPSVETVLEALMATQLPIGLFTDASFQTPVGLE
jgi:predicted transcriptional regulator